MVQMALSNRSGRKVFVGMKKEFLIFHAFFYKKIQHQHELELKHSYDPCRNRGHFESHRLGRDSRESSVPYFYPWVLKINYASIMGKLKMLKAK